MTPDEWKEIFSNNLTSILEERGMTQNELSKESGVSKGRISDYINGYTTPSLFAAINMAYALDIDIGEFVDFDETVKW